jgi:hypothetical protein
MAAGVCQPLRARFISRAAVPGTRGGRPKFFAAKTGLFPLV